MKRILLLFIALFILQISQAQRNCGTMDYLEQQILENPQIQNNLDQLEKYTKDFLINNTDREQNGNVITIPVIVHVVYQNSTENISDQQINSQITVLNDDFRRLNSDADNIWGQASDTYIEFCLTQVVRVPTTVNSFGTNNSVKFSSQGGSDVINPAGAMNLWVCEIGGGILGYAQFPGGSSSTDGIVVDYRYFGTITPQNGGTATAPFDLGRTTTHEVGHYLNLRHIWGDGGCNQDDFVSDTPLAGGPNYTGEPCTFPGPNSCRPKGRPGQDDDPDMFQNYMDYSDDACMNLFTLGQKNRMQAAISASRPGLITSSCSGTGEPTCTDGIQNGDETGVDCGGSSCPACPTPTCDDGIQNGSETGVDCGGPDCAPCETPTCEAPTGLTHERKKGGREALLSWNSVAGALSYDFEISDASGNTTSVNISGTSVTVTGLTKGAPYTWQVRSNCAGGIQSPWATSSFNARLFGNFQNDEVNAYPNPTNQDMITINWDLAGHSEIGIFESNISTNQVGNVRIQVRDLNGRVLMNQKELGSNNTMQLNTSGLDAGIYFIQVIDEKGYSAGTKLVKL